MTAVICAFAVGWFARALYCEIKYRHLFWWGIRYRAWRYGPAVPKWKDGERVVLMDGVERFYDKKSGELRVKL